MGWIPPEEQAYVRRQFKRGATYICDADFCGEPIFHGELPVVDPKGGYYPKPPGSPQFAAREPKITYHITCDLKRRGKHVPYKTVPPGQSAHLTQGENENMKTKSKKATETKEEVITKKGAKASKKAEQVEAKAEKKSAKTNSGSGNGEAKVYFGSFRANTAIGQIVEELYNNGINKRPVKVSVLKKLAAGTSLPGRISVITRRGGETGFFKVQRSKAGDGYIMFVKQPKKFLGA